MHDHDEPDVRWVASQPIPALRALVREAERDKHAGQDPASPPPPRPFPPRRASARSTARPAYVPTEEEPEAVAFVQKLKDAFKKLDENSLKKQRLRALTKTSSASAILPRRTLAKTASLGPASLRSASAPLPVSDGDAPMQDVVDLTETDTDCTSRANTTQLLDDDDDSMDLSFFHAEPPPPSKPKSQPPRTRTGPPPLGMRRAPLFQPSQYSASQGPKGVTVPRFKPPLLKSATKPPSRVATTKVAMAPKAAQENQDPDSSFDMSFDMDIDTLEEVMKPYDKA